MERQKISINTLDFNNIARNRSHPHGFYNSDEGGLTLIWTARREIHRRKEMHKRTVTILIFLVIINSLIFEGCSSIKTINSRTDPKEMAIIAGSTFNKGDFGLCYFRKNLYGSPYEMCDTLYTSEVVKDSKTRYFFNAVPPGDYALRKNALRDWNGKGKIFRVEAGQMVNLGYVEFVVDEKNICDTGVPLGFSQRLFTCRHYKYHIDSYKDDSQVRRIAEGSWGVPEGAWEGSPGRRSIGEYRYHINIGKDDSIVEVFKNAYPEVFKRFGSTVKNFDPF